MVREQEKVGVQVQSKICTSVQSQSVLHTAAGLQQSRGQSEVWPTGRGLRARVVAAVWWWGKEGIYFWFQMSCCLSGWALPTRQGCGLQDGSCLQGCGGVGVWSKGWYGNGKLSSSSFNSL